MLPSVLPGAPLSMGVFKALLLLLLLLASLIGIGLCNNCPDNTPTTPTSGIVIEGVNITTFFPFNLTDESATNLSYISNSYEQRKNISTTRVFGVDYTDFWIGLTGYISFGGPYFGRERNAEEIDVAINVENDVQALFVYYCPESYADVDHSVFHDEITQGDLLCRFTEQLKGAEPRAAPLDFIPTSLQVVTWYNTSCGFYFGGLDDEAQNIDPIDLPPFYGHFFQVVIGTNGTMTYVFYIYGILPDLDDDDEFMEQENLFSQNGVVGFIRIDSTGRPIEYREPGNSSSFDDTTGNYGQPGLYIYEIDHPDGQMYSPPDCTPDVSLRVSQNFALQCGGKRIFIYGPCYYSGDVKCSFGGSVVDAVIVDNSTAYCVTPFIAVYGRITLGVSIDGGTTYDYTTNFHIIGRDDNYQIERVQPYGPWYTAPFLNPMIKWQNGTLNGGGGNVNIDVVEFTATGAIGCVIRVASNVPNTGLATLPNAITEDSAEEKLLLFCAIRITSADEPPEEALWSDYHPCLWFDARLFLKIWLDNSPTDISAIVTEVISAPIELLSIAADIRTLLNRTIGPSACNEWVDDEILNPADFTSDPQLDPAPCTQEEARRDWRRWWWTCDRVNPEPFWMDDDCQFYHENAFTCFTTRWPLRSQVACYNSTGGLIIDPDDGGVGTAYRESRRWWSRPFYHIINDLRPFVACCKASYNCTEYYKRRPISNCTGYELPLIPWTGGDPHFITFDNRAYTFNGFGEYHLILHSQINLQIRTILLPLASNQGTALGGVALRRGALSSIVEVFRGESLVVRVDGVEQNLTAFINSVFTISDDSVSILLYSSDELDLRFPAGSVCDGEVIRVRQVSGVLQVSTLLPDCYRGQVKGLNGNFDGNSGNEFELSNGGFISDSSSPENIHNLFGESWRVESGESLFFYGENENHGTFNVPSYQPAFFTDGELLTTPGGGFCNGNLQCLYDFRVTGSQAFATETMGAVEEVMEVFELFKSTSNPCLSNPCVVGECTPLSTPTLVIYICTCPPGYGGVNCEEERCNPNPCENSGICRPDTSNDRYSCDCRLGYAGTNCERDACDPSPCENGGTCTPDISVLRYSCDCTVGYVGTNCTMEDSATLCPRSPCINSSQCLFIDGEYICICEPGYTGSFCEQEITPCDSLECLNGGTCNSETGYVCQCHPSYTGSQCETALCNVNPCQNDAACKEDEEGVAQCTCLPGFSGIYCHISDDDLREKTIISLVLFAILTVILLIILALTLAALGVRCPIISPLLAPMHPRPVGLVKVGVRRRVVAEPRIHPVLRQGPVYGRPIMFNKHVFGPP